MDVKIFLTLESKQFNAESAFVVAAIRRRLNNKQPEHCSHSFLRGNTTIGRIQGPSLVLVVWQSF